MDGIVGWVSAPGPSGWQGDEVFSEVQRWNRTETEIQMKTPCCPENFNFSGFDRRECSLVYFPPWRK